jgi:putative toxin-antitoxin system antitoxin component (TIGR02293 family)
MENTKEEQIIKQLLGYIRKENQANSVSVEESMPAYGFTADKFFMVNIIRNGLPYAVFNLIHELVPFSDTDWAKYLDVSTKTMLRYKQSQKKFRSIHSEKILEMAEVTITGLEVFGNMSKFKLWLQTPNYALGNHKPLSLVNDSYGKDMVIAELNNINHGIFA